MQRARSATCAGYCRDCEREHSLPEGNARYHAQTLMREFERLGRLDYCVSDAEADPALSFDELFAGTQGNMFGVLECRDGSGSPRVLRAFSSMPRGIREVEGWVPPILSAETFYGLLEPARQRIEQLTRELDGLEPGTSAHRTGYRERSRMSRALSEELQGHYRFHNFRGQVRPLPDALCHDGPVPGGVGECCAPRLLDYAARNGLRPLGLAEFYWGSERGTGGLKQGEFYPACDNRCGPLLGFMLCGLEGNP